MISDQGLQRLYRVLPVPTVLINRYGIIIDSNPAASALFGRPVSALVDTPILRWIDAADRDRAREHFTHSLRGRTVEWTARIIRGNGALRGAQFRVASLSVRDRTAPIVVYLQETETEVYARDDAQQIRDLLEIVPGQFVSIIEPSGRLTYSGGLARTLWYDDEGFYGRNFTELLAEREENLPRYEALLRQALSGERWDGVIWLRRADQVKVPFHLYAVPYQGREARTIVGALILGRDISQELESRDEHEREKRFCHIGELAVGIAYELEQPLTRLDQIATEIEQDEVTGGPGERLGEEIRKMDRLLSGLRAFARDPMVTRRKVEVEPLIDEALAEQRYLLAESGIKITTSIAEDLPEFYLDTRQFVAVLRILLENAREALEGQDSGMIVLTVFVRGGRLVVRCQDNAPLERDDWVENAFDPFFTTKVGRLGLDLAVAKGIVEEHGGTIWAARSTDGWTTVGWTTVTFELPSEPPPPTPSFRMAPLMLGRSRSVLVVDHDPSIRSLLRRLLERVGYRVAEAWSGRSAIAEITSGEPPELMITGLKMKDGSGQWLLEEIARDFPALSRRVVIVTADPSQIEGSQIARELEAPVLRKPVDFHILLETLDELSVR